MEKEQSVVDIFIDAYADKPIKEEIKPDAYEDKKKRVLDLYHKICNWADNADIRTSCRCNVTTDQLQEWLKEDAECEQKPLAESSDKLNEASTAEKKSLKLGGKATDDLARGRGIASIKDKDERDAAVAALKAGRKDLVDKEFIGDRKNLHIENDLDKKATKMQQAMTEECLDEDVLNHDCDNSPAIIPENDLWEVVCVSLDGNRIKATFDNKDVAEEYYNDLKANDGYYMYSDIEIHNLSSDLTEDLCEDAVCDNSSLKDKLFSVK